MTWNNLLAWCLQIAVLVAAGSLAASLFRLRPPAARLLYFQALLLLCLSLPFLQPWARPAVMMPVQVSRPAPAISETVPVAPGWAWEDAVASVLAAGMMLRLGWFALGLLRLRRYRIDAREFAQLPDAVERLRRELGIYPVMALSEEVSGPVTFGVFDPVILFPARFVELSPDVQAALAGHELLHVRRRDWLFTAIEELVRAVFWFHPAVWWLLGQIQLAREQAVDRAVVNQTLARGQYVDALLAASGARQQLDLLPAPLFLRRRHLTRRVAALLKEGDMSKRRLYSSLLACCGGLVLAGWLAVGSWPLRAMPQMTADSPGIAVSGVERLIHRAPVEYPAAALEKRIEGTVLLDVQVADDGTVADASVLSGPMELRKAALASVLEWHFMKEAAGRQQVSVEFRLPEPGAARPVAAQTLPFASSKAAFRGFVFERLSPQAIADLRARLPQTEGQPIMEAYNSAVQVVREYDPHLIVAIKAAVDGEQLQVAPLTTSLARGIPPIPMSGDASRIAVGGGVQATKLIRQVPPVYPPVAKRARVQGVVELSVVVDKEGKVSKISLLSGHPLLVPAAMEAVRQWEYRPTLLNGNPVEVISTVDLNFRLQE